MSAYSSGEISVLNNQRVLGTVMVKSEVAVISVLTKQVRASLNHD